MAAMILRDSCLPDQVSSKCVIKEQFLYAPIEYSVTASRNYRLYKFMYCWTKVEVLLAMMYSLNVTCQ